MKQTLQNILVRELNRLDEASQTGPLDFEDVKKLESLTRALKQLDDPPKERDEELDLSYEDLLSLAKLKVDDDDNTKPRYGSERKAASRPKKGRRRVVETGEDT